MFKLAMDTSSVAAIPPTQPRWVKMREQAVMPVLARLSRQPMTPQPSTLVSLVLQGLAYKAAGSAPHRHAGQP